MKATGIVRRIDELGRVVIPKEIRKTLRIREGDPLEIYTDKEDVLFRKYSPIASMEEEAASIEKSLREVTDLIVILFDTDGVIAASGKDTKDLLGEEASDELSRMMQERTTRIVSGAADEATFPLFKREIFPVKAEVAVPVVAGGDLLGCVVLASKEPLSFGEKELAVAKCAASILANRFS